MAISKSVTLYNGRVATYHRLRKITARPAGQWGAEFDMHESAGSRARNVPPLDRHSVSFTRGQGGVADEAYAAALADPVFAGGTLV